MKVRLLYMVVVFLVLLINACGGNGAGQPGTIQGDVFLDCNQNGECDCDDIGFSDVSIQIFRDQCAGVPLQTISTDDQGSFIFIGMDPGVYCVMSNLKPNCGGYFPTTTITQTVTLGSGQDLQLESFGYSLPGQ